MKIKPHLRAGAAAILTLLCGNTFLSAQDASRPSPYPKEESAYPGQGPVRYYPYMNDYRKHFWSKRTEAQGAVVFAGDSLTGYWKTLGSDFPKLKIANRGLVADMSRGLLFRFKEDVLDLNPKAIVMLIGTNDLSAHGAITDTVANISLMLDMIEKTSPSPPVILCSIPPRESLPPIDNNELLKLNAAIESLAQSKPYVTFVDLYPQFLTAEGKFDEKYFRPDKIHLIEPGYKKWTETLKPVFAKLKLE